jgi:hypothetical protein
MHHLVELRRQACVDGGNRLVDRPRQVAIEGDRAGQRLLDERLDEILRPVGLGLFGCRDDLLEQTGADGGFGCSRGGFRRKVGIRNGSALLLVEPQFTGQGLELAFILQDLLE